MPYRRLPQTDEQRTDALLAAKKAVDGLDPAETPAISSDTITRLNTLYPTWKTEVAERQTALKEQGTASKSEDAQQRKVTQFISHFIQVFNLGVARGKYSAAERVHYNMDINQEELPKLTKEKDVDRWGMYLIEGDPKRIAAGGAPMQNPNIAQVEAEYNAWMTLGTMQDKTKTTYDSEQEDVEDLRPDADSLILDIWDEVEFTYRRDDAPSKRRKARIYGVVYVSRPDEEPEEGVLPAEV